MRYLLALVAFVCTVGNPAYAKWPTTDWTIREESLARAVLPAGERALIAQKYQESLERGSIWFQNIGFKAPYQLNEQKSLGFKGNERYLAYLQSDILDISSYQDLSGKMVLSTYPGFLRPKFSLDRLFSAAAVHELFHGIQKVTPEFRKFILREIPGSPNCGSGERADKWLTEGTASAVQVQYLERTNGYVYGHQFSGSSRAAWVRHFDQRLDWPSIPPEHLEAKPTDNDKRQSWLCSYGTWYFWYAVGNMLGSKDPRDLRRTEYLRHIFEQKGEWQGTGLAMVDSGLKLAAEKLDAISTYRGGLFSLYPQFVAQYLTTDAFFENVEAVTMTTPSLYETTSSLRNGPIEPIATRAWRFRVQLPKNDKPMPYTVRFVLESSDQDSLEALHLIVDSKVVDHPSDPTVPYSYTRRTDQAIDNNQGELEYFVRVANVAQEAAITEAAEFTLRVEIEGFYGSTITTGPSDDAIAGELRPGFEITGPGKYWTCSGGDDARASFTIVTPDGHADQLLRMVPQGLKNIDSDFDNLEMTAHDQGKEEKLKRIQRQRKKFDGNMQAELESKDVLGDITRAANEIRRTNETNIMAKLYGSNTEGDCSVTFNVTLPGRQSAAQKVTGEHFNVMVTPESVSNLRAALVDFAGGFDFSSIDLANLTEGDLERYSETFTQNNPMVDFDEPDSDWTSCGTNEKGCDVGVLTLEHASHDHLSGTFEFDLSRRNDETNRMEYRKVTGILNITSSQTEGDNSLLDFMSRGQQLGEPMYAPGMEKLLQGGSMFGD